MTVIKSSLRSIWDARQLSFTALITELSQKPNLPTSIHVRNLLLSGLASREEPDALIASLTRNKSESEKSEVLWKQLASYQPAIQVAVFGDAPRKILCGGNDIQGNGASEEHVQQRAGAKPWAVAILKCSVFRQAGDVLSYLRRPDLSIWLSSESYLAQGQLGREDKSTSNLDADSLELFKSIVEDWLPGAYEQFQRELLEYFGIETQEQRDNVRKECGAEKEVNVLAFAMDNNVSDALLQWSKEPESRVSIDWHATYGTLQRYEKDSGCDEEEAIGSAGRWALERLGEESVRVVSLLNNKCNC